MAFRKLMFKNSGIDFIKQIFLCFFSAIPAIGCLQIANSPREHFTIKFIMFLCGLFFILGSLIIIYKILKGLPSCSISEDKISFKDLTIKWSIDHCDVEQVNIECNSYLSWIKIQAKNTDKNLFIFGFSNKIITLIYEKIVEFSRNKIHLENPEDNKHITKTDYETTFTSTQKTSNFEKNTKKTSQHHFLYQSDSPMSFSRLRTFDECKLKFKYRYIDSDKKTIFRSKSADIGNTVHEAIELILNHHKKDNYIYDTAKALDEKLTNIVSKLNGPKEIEKSWKLIGKFVVNFNITMAEIHSIEVEKISRLPSGHHFKWIPDLILAYSSQSKPTYEVVDFKTGRIDLYKNFDQFKTKQVLIYASLLQHELFTKTVSGRYYFIDKNESIGMTLDINKSQEIIQFIDNKISEVYLERKFAPNPHSFVCQGCEYKSQCNYSFKRKSA